MKLKVTENRILGGGGFGLVLETDDGRALKLIKNIDECKILQKEIEIHHEIEKVLNFHRNKSEIPPASVPHIHETFQKVVNIKINGKENSFLCGILMDKIEPLMNNGVQFHPTFGLVFDNDEIDRIHYVSNSEFKDVRGFYGSAETLEDLIPEIDIENLVIRMAKTFKYLILAGIAPIDIEFVVDKFGELWILDFGLCKMFSQSIRKLSDEEILKEFYTKKGLEGLDGDIYIPVYSSLKKLFKENYFGI